MAASLALLAWSATATPAAPRVIAVSISGVIQPVTADILSRAVEQARAEHAAALLIRLNTPGGLLEATRTIIERLDASPVPVITYVTPGGGRAASAGFFVLEAGDIAAMAPGTNTGAASPIVLGSQMDPVLRSKVENDSAALLRTLTSRRNRNSDLAEQTIRQAVAFTDKEALDKHLIEVVAPTEEALLRDIDGREAIRINGERVTLHVANAAIVEFEPTVRERLLSTISDPNIGFVLLVLGVLGLYVEFSHPGLIVPGVAGAVLALLGLSSLSVFPISWIGVALLILVARTFRFGSEIRLARDPGRGRRGGDAAGGADAGEWSAGSAHPAEHCAGGDVSVRLNHHIFGFAGDARPRREGGNGRHRDVERDGGGADGARSRRDGDGARRVLEGRVEPSGGGGSEGEDYRR